MRKLILISIICSVFSFSCFGQEGGSNFSWIEEDPEFIDYKKIPSKESNFVVGERVFEKSLLNSSSSSQKGYAFSSFLPLDISISKKFNAGIIFVDKKRFKELGISMLWGESQSVYLDRFNVLISERMAKLLFGNDNPLDKVLIWDDKYSVMVKGVYKERNKVFPLEFDFITGYL